MILLGLCFLIPLYIMVINSFKNRAELYMSPVALPDVLRIENYVEAIDRMNFLTSFSNSLLVTIAEFQNGGAFLRSNRRKPIQKRQYVCAFLLL